jgi:hypothetical protein
MDDGKLVSTYASGNGIIGSAEVKARTGIKRNYFDNCDYPILTYHPNRIISAPKDSAGIFLATREILKARSTDLFKQGIFSKCRARIFEVKPLAVLSRFECFYVCKVVRLGKEVNIYGNPVKKRQGD